jgi:hypothetical protein
MTTRSGIEQARLLASMLRDPDYWESLMNRAREPLFWGGPSLGAMVPGLNTYMMTTGAQAAAQRGDYGAAVGHAVDAATQLLPVGPAAKMTRSFGLRGRMVPTPGITTTAPLTPEDEERLQKRREELRKKYLLQP